LFYGPWFLLKYDVEAGFALVIGQNCPIIDLDRLLGLQELETLRISTQSAHTGGKVVSPKHRPPLPSSDILDTYFR
jgi:hypothetical protein